MCVYARANIKYCLMRTLDLSHSTGGKQLVARRRTCSYVLNFKGDNLFFNIKTQFKRKKLCPLIFARVALDLSKVLFIYLLFSYQEMDSKYVQ